MAVGKTRVLLEPKLVAAMGVETVERCLQRKMPDTVLSWSAECRENNRPEEVSAIRSMFGSPSFLSNTA